MEKKTIIGIIYSIISAIILPFTLYLQVFSLFLFDAPGSTEKLLPYVLVFGILLIPIVLVGSTIMFWYAIKKLETKHMIIYGLLPVVYPVVFFLFWLLIDLFQ